MASPLGSKQQLLVPPQQPGSHLRSQQPERSAFLLVLVPVLELMPGPQLQLAPEPMPLLMPEPPPRPGLAPKLALMLQPELVPMLGLRPMLKLKLQLVVKQPHRLEQWPALIAQLMVVTLQLVDHQQQQQVEQQQLPELGQPQLIAHLKPTLGLPDRQQLGQLIHRRH